MPCRRYYQNTIIPGEALAAPALVGFGSSVLGTQLLTDDKLVEQSIEARCAAARALARQFFGVLLVPKSAADGWLADGLAGYLEGVFVQVHSGF